MHECGSLQAINGDNEPELVRAQVLIYIQQVANLNSGNLWLKRLPRFIDVIYVQSNVLNIWSYHMTSLTGGWNFPRGLLGSRLGEAC